MTSLSGTLPELQAAYNQLVAYARSQGITIGVADFGAVRTLADTNTILGYRNDDYRAAVNAGQITPDTSLNAFRPIAPFGRSYHNYGAAFDVSIIGRPSGMSEYQAESVLGAYAPNIGLRWGGTFSNPDNPHFELAIPLADAQARYVAAGGSATTDTSALSQFNLSNLLPSLTPTDAYDTDAIDASGFPDDISVSYDDSGEAIVEAEGTGIDGMVIAGVLLAGVVLWALRRKFLSVTQ